MGDDIYNHYPVYDRTDDVPLTLSGIEKYLKDKGIDAKVYDSYTDSSLPSHCVGIETNTDEWTLWELLRPRWPLGTQLMVIKPGSRACICFGPPVKSCPVHKL